MQVPKVRRVEDDGAVRGEPEGVVHRRQRRVVLRDELVEDRCEPVPGFRCDGAQPLDFRVGDIESAGPGVGHTEELLASGHIGRVSGTEGEEGQTQAGQRQCHGVGELIDDEEIRRFDLSQHRDFFAQAHGVGEHVLLPVARLQHQRGDGAFARRFKERL